MTAVAYGIAMPASRGTLSAVPYCQPAVSFFQRLATQPTAARKALYNALISSLVSAGVWSKLDALYVLAAADQATALTNLVQASYGATAANAPAFTADQGYVGANTKYIDTGFNPTTALSPNYTRNDAAIFAWGSSVAAVGGCSFASVQTASAFPNSGEIVPRWTSGGFYAALNSAEVLIASSPTDGSGLRTITRSDPSSITAYSNALSSGATAAASTAIANTTLALLGYSNSEAYTATVYTAGFGGSLTASEVTALYDALHAYLQAVAGVA
jgi:hypothetical protein